MPDREGAPKGNQPEVDQGRRALLGTGLGLVATTLALDALALGQPVDAAVRAGTNFRNRGKLNCADTVLRDTHLTHGITQGGPAFTQETLSTSGRVNTLPSPNDTTLTQQGTMPDIEAGLPQDGVKFFEDNWKTILSTGGPLAVLGGAAGGILGYRLRVKDREAAEIHWKEELRLAQERLRITQEELRLAQESADDEHFRWIRTGLASGELVDKAAAASSLLQLLQEPGHERYYEEIFKTAVNYLRGRPVDKNASIQPNQVHDQVNRDLQPDQFYSEIIKVFKRSAPLVVKKLKERYKIDLEALSQLEDQNQFIRSIEKYLDASNIHLEGSYLGSGKLFIGERRIQLPADDSGAILPVSVKTDAAADLKYVYMRGAKFNGALILDADFTYADLQDSDLTNARLRGVTLSHANLFGADLAGADPEHAARFKLEGTKMDGVKNYDDRDKRIKCYAEGAKIKIPSEPSTSPTPDKGKDNK